MSDIVDWHLGIAMLRKVKISLWKLLPLLEYHFWSLMLYLLCLLCLYSTHLLNRISKMVLLNWKVISIILMPIEHKRSINRIYNIWMNMMIMLIWLWVEDETIYHVTISNKIIDIILVMPEIHIVLIIL